MTTEEALKQLLIKDNKINPEMLQLITVFVMISIIKRITKGEDKNERKTKND